MLLQKNVENLKLLQIFSQAPALFLLITDKILYTNDILYSNYLCHLT